jgi:hypothetical protein
MSEMIIRPTMKFIYFGYAAVAQTPRGGSATC